MEVMETLQGLVVVLAGALLTAYLMSRLRVPTVVGYILAGVILGPNGINLIADRSAIEVSAEIGVVFLLFTIGLKFSLRELLIMRTEVFFGGGLQVGATIGLATLLGVLAGAPVHTAVFLSFLAALSSTAIVLKALEERGELNAPHGRFTMGVLIFQDLAVVPLMILTATLGSGGEVTWAQAGGALVKSLSVLLAILATAYYLFPWFLEQVVRTRNREVFILAVVFVVLGTALVVGEAGLSLALGAFLAGMAVSRSEYAQQMMAEILPVKDALGSVFFVSVGMLVNPWAMLNDPFSYFGAMLAVITLKAVVVLAVALMLGCAPRAAMLAAFALAQIGEFSFVLAMAGKDLGLINEALHGSVLSISAFTMALTPIMMGLARKLANLADQYGFWDKLPVQSRALAHELEKLEQDGQALHNHVIIVGYGVNGRNVARVLGRLGATYAILELNAHTVRMERGHGELIFYGDASRLEVLRHAGIERARTLVVAIADPASCRQITAVARQANPSLVILVRTRFLAEVADLYRLGANEVIPEEFETSLELARRIMRAYDAPEYALQRELEAIRAQHYGAMTGRGVGRRSG